MKKYFIRFFAVIALVAMWTACNEQESYLQGPDEVMSLVPTLGTASTPISDGGVTPYIIPGANPGGNRTCLEVSHAFGLDPFEFSSDRVNYNDGSFDVAFPVGLSVTVTDGVYVSFTYTSDEYCVGAVIVKGGADANVYVYENGTTGDSGLASPVNPNNGSAGLSNITFCFVKCDSQKCYKDETAWAANGAEPGKLRYNTRGNWATYVEYKNVEKTVNIYAGQTMLAGIATFSAPTMEGKVNISITLINSFIFFWDMANVLEDNNVKVQDYSSKPSGNPAPGLFAWKEMAPFGSTSWTISVPVNKFYGVHLDVAKEVPCQ
jgi:hypothetical protein